MQQEIPIDQNISVDPEVSRRLAPDLQLLRQVSESYNKRLLKECLHQNEDRAERFAECVEHRFDRFQKQQILTFFRLDFVERKYNECLHAGTSRDICVNRAAELGKQIAQSATLNIENS